MMLTVLFTANGQAWMRLEDRPMYCYCRWRNSV